MSPPIKTKSSKPKLMPPPHNVAALRAVDRAFIHSVMFEMGILPMEDPSFDMRRPQATLSKEEARVMTRKFRKLWRKYMRQQLGPGNLADAKVKAEVAKRQFGVGKPAIARKQRLERKRLVYEGIWNDYIAPLIQRFEHPPAQPKVADEGSPA